MNAAGRSTKDALRQGALQPSENPSHPSRQAMPAKALRQRLF